MKTELQEALHRLMTRPTPQVVAEAEQLAKFATRNFANKDQVEAAAAIMARITLGEGTYCGISCMCPQSCAESSLIYGWMQFESGLRFHIPPEIRTELSDKLVVWKGASSSCSCVLGHKSRTSRHEEAVAARANESLEAHEEYMKTFGHNCASVTGW